MNIKPLIGIMVKSLEPLPHYEIAKNLNVDLLVFSPKGINWSTKKISGLLLGSEGWEIATQPFPLAIYNRRYSSKYNLTNKLESVIGKGKVFNYITKFDKWTNYRALLSSEFKHLLPDTYLYDQNILLKLLKKYQIMILKPCKGCLAKKVYRLELTTSNEFHLCFKTNIPRFKTTNGQDFIEEINKITGKKRFVLQQFINMEKINEQIYDIRTYVQKNSLGQWEITGACSRESLVKYYITNCPRRIKSIDKLISEENSMSLASFEKMKAISLQVAELLEKKLGHLGEICVDFGIDDRGTLWIIELNGMPQKLLIDRLNNEELSKTIYLKPIEYALYLANNLNDGNLDPI